MERLEQQQVLLQTQQQEHKKQLQTQQQQLQQQHELVCFMGHAMDVVVFCSANPQVGAAARSMADTGRRLLAGEAAAGSDACALYLELQARVKKFCRMDLPMTAALESREAAVLGPVRGNSG
jgi:hypothetical protein